MNSGIHKNLVRYLWDVVAVIFIIWGIIAFVTPLTPASWLFIVGLIIIFGKHKTKNIIIKVVGIKWFNKLKLNSLIDKLSDKDN
ncbi:MAG: hypothetical protein AAB638_02500 [Patescibacteria group bacterium]